MRETPTATNRNVGTLLGYHSGVIYLVIMEVVVDVVVGVEQRSDIVTDFFPNFTNRTTRILFVFVHLHTEKMLMNGYD